VVAEEKTPETDEGECVRKMNALFSGSKYDEMLALAAARREKDPESGCATRFERKAKQARDLERELEGTGSGKNR